MKRINVLMFALMVAASTFMLSSCVMEPLVDESSTKVQFDLDWSQIGANITPPSLCYAKFSGSVYSNGVAFRLESESHEIAEAIEVGTHEILVHNTPEGVVIDDLTNTASFQPVDQGGVTGNSEWLFSWAGTKTVEAYKKNVISATMKQHTRGLNIILHIPGSRMNNIKTITAVLTGAAGSLDLATGVMGTAEVNVNPVFEASSAANRWEADTRLFGFIGTAEHKLTITTTYKDSTPATVNEYDLDELAPELITEFNMGDKRLPMTLNLDAAEVGGVEGDIGDWNNGGDYAWYI